MSWRIAEYEKYCDDVVNTATWGGQLEVNLLAMCLYGSAVPDLCSIPSDSGNVKRAQATNTYCADGIAYVEGWRAF